LGYSGLEYFERDGILKLLKGFEVTYFEEEIKTLYFDSAYDILKHIKATGVSRFAKTQKGLWTKSHIEKFEKEYRERFCGQNGVGLTYHPIYCLAKKL
ncbi:Malonyl-[acyl-carrier protein] O-methyltransferase, partial [Candidatus Gastranaerophilus sp. (ex Termes propinquus)]